MAKLPSTLLSARAAPGCLCSSPHPLLASSRPAVLSSRTAKTTPAAGGGSSATTIQVRHATLVRRPQRPYTFTQLVQLSDGSTYTVRTTSPQGTYKSVKDSRNHARWQPSDKSLRNVEVDEAGKLAAFRERYGRGWDAATPAPAPKGGEQQAASGAGGKDAPSAAPPQEEEALDLTDLIGGYATAAGLDNANTGMSAKEAAKAEKSQKKGKKAKLL